jgi:hypothetical protein
MPIFVAGTGRCGTTRLAKLLGTHPDVFTIPDETRFLVDPDGLEDLVEDLTSRYTTFHAAEAIRRFGGARDAAGKSVWCEKTPYNLLSLPFLWELFPDAAVVHLKRDPRGVANSMARQWWAPDDIDDVVSWLADTYRRWLTVRSGIDFEARRYVEVRVEDLAADPETRADLLASLGLPDVPLGGWFEEKVNWWTFPQGMPRNWREKVESRLGWAIEAMGYGAS